MKKRPTNKKPIRKVTNAEEQQERAELAKYRASLRRIQETERLAKKLRRAVKEVPSICLELARDIAYLQNYRLVPIETPAGADTE